MKINPALIALKIQNKKPRGLTLNKLIPNILTVTALCSGLTAIRFAIEGNWEFAVMAILLAAILDGLDGRVARLINGTSGFGAQLDSLCDVISFGVVPAMVMYFWVLEDLGRLGWVASLLFVVCAAVRLARFNLQIDDPNRPSFAAHFFSGVPTPAAAGLALAPLILSFKFGEIFHEPIAIAVWMFMIAGMMVSTFPTYSFKKVKIDHDDVSLILVGVGIIAGALFAETWLTMGLLILAYVALMPASFFSYRKMRLAEKQRMAEQLPLEQMREDAIDKRPA